MRPLRKGDIVAAVLNGEQRITHVTHDEEAPDGVPLVWLHHAIGTVQLDDAILKGWLVLFSGCRCAP